MANYSDYNFEFINDDNVLITNYAGRYVLLSSEEFESFRKKNPKTEIIKKLQDGYFYSTCEKEEFVENYARAIHNYREYLFSGTGLHIFVLTTSCNLNCLYCQASTQKNGKHMSKDTAMKLVDIALKSPNKVLSFEFQGGEPLANFDVLKFIVEYTEDHKGNKKIIYNLVSNLTLINDEILKFLLKYDISISTSLDGNRLVHNYNRPMNGANSYDKFCQKLKFVRAAVGGNIGAIQTTTKESLKYYKEIVDEYVTLGFERIFIRPLTPLGYAAKMWGLIGYEPEEFLEFYTNSLEYILSLCKKGIPISEGHATIFLRKILLFKAGNYTELISPCGAVLGQIAYNHDGRIYTCDEGRMLSEMGDNSFQIGDENSEYEELFNNPVCKAIATASCLETIPQCSDCVFSPYCGVCPVLTYYEQKSIFSRKPNSYKCKIYKGMLQYIFKKLLFGSDEEKRILLSWCLN